MYRNVWQIDVNGEMENLLLFGIDFATSSNVDFY